MHGYKEEINYSKKTPSKSKKPSTKKSVSTQSTGATSAAVKSAGITTTSTNKPSDKDIFKQLNSWNWILAGLYGLSGIVLAAFSMGGSSGTDGSEGWGNAVYRSVTSSYVTEDTLAGGDDQVLVQASRTLFDANIGYLVAAVLLISAAAYLVRATVKRKEYEHALAKEHTVYRMIDYGIAGGLAVATIGLVVGVSSLASLLVMVAAVKIAVMGWNVMESMNHSDDPKINWRGLCVSAAAAALPWVIILITLFSARKYAEGEIPAYMYWLVVIPFAMTIAHVLVEKMRYTRKNGSRELAFVNAEWTHMMISFVLKASFAGILFFSLLNK